MGLSNFKKKKGKDIQVLNATYAIHLKNVYILQNEKISKHHTYKALKWNKVIKSHLPNNICLLYIPVILGKKICERYPMVIYSLGHGALIKRDFLYIG